MSITIHITDAQRRQPSPASAAALPLNPFSEAALGDLARRGLLLYEYPLLL